MRKKRILAMVLIIVLSLAGCWLEPVDTTEPGPRVVTEISITRESDQLTKHYTKDEQLNVFLNYLRLVSPKGPPVTEILDQPSKEAFEIHVYYSDGTEKYYRQKGLMYLYDDNQEWKEIDPGIAARLPQLFEENDE